VLQLQQAVRDVNISDDIKRYIVDIVQETRNTEAVKLGAGPRASLALMQICQALALLDGLNFVTPEHVQEVAIPVLSHRLALDSQAKYSGKTTEQVVLDILGKVAVPK